MYIHTLSAFSTDFFVATKSLQCILSKCYYVAHIQKMLCKLINQISKKITGEKSSTRYSIVLARAATDVVTPETATTELSFTPNRHTTLIVCRVFCSFSVSLSQDSRCLEKLLNDECLVDECCGFTEKFENKYALLIN